MLARLIVAVPGRVRLCHRAQRLSREAGLDDVGADQPVGVIGCLLQLELLHQHAEHV